MYIMLNKGLKAHQKLYTMLTRSPLSCPARLSRLPIDILLIVYGNTGNGNFPALT